MAQHDDFSNGIPISTSLTSTLDSEQIRPGRSFDKVRLIKISALAVCIAALVSVIAKLLIYLIDFVTNLAFYGRFSIQHASPATNHLGLFVLVIPVIGGVIIGLMAFYGSKAIRGHGIPEAMEQILTNQSRINPIITYLKPISSAISIGTGGPFGAEGPIIATGGALGSTIGQVLKITHQERKTLLAAGATAGMSAIFGTPVAAIFLAIELLLFEFSPRSIIPVALACVTGAAGHHLLFESGPVFPMPEIISMPGNMALAGYSIMGLLIGLLSVIVTKVVYFIEDGFEHLPIHWMWWPAIGGLAVGGIGYFAPRTLGVGYDNIIDVLSGSLPLHIVLSLCLLKFASWAISLGSGTSGGTLAPLLTVGGATGVLIGSLFIALFPSAGMTLPLAALVGMSAMFAGASRALLTSIVFAIEATSQSGALLPLLAACTGSYVLSFLLMENTIMTEKIARRGVKTPYSYEPDILEKVAVREVVKDTGLVLSEDSSIDEARSWLTREHDQRENYFIISSAEGEYRGIISTSNLYSHHHDPSHQVGSLIRRAEASVYMDDSLKQAAEIMSVENIDVLPVLSPEGKSIIGILSYLDIMTVYKQNVTDHSDKHSTISLKGKGLKILLRGQKLMSFMQSK